MDQELLDRIKVLYEIGQLDELETAERLLDAHLTLHPEDAEAWLRLFMVVISDILDDEEKAILCCKNILAYDPYNVGALLALFYVYYYASNSYEDEMVEKLFACHGYNNESMSLIELTRARYYENNNNMILQEKALLKSITYCDYFVCNYESLGYFYVMQEQWQEARFCLEMGLHNIKTIYGSITEATDSSSIETLFDEFLRGTLMTEIRRDRMKSILDDCNKILEEESLGGNN